MSSDNVEKLSKIGPCLCLMGDPKITIAAAAKPNQDKGKLSPVFPNKIAWMIS